MNSEIMDLKNLHSSNLDTQKQHIQKSLPINDIKSSLHQKYVTELLSIRILQGNKIIGVYHLPEEVVIKPDAKKIEIHDTDGSLIETFGLVERNLSLLDNAYTDCSEIIVDLHVKV